ncbi:helix-turn-helix domain-containing protein [Sphingobium yanoikuyae]|uniref:winged helix-turn-helix domain-containing protein n=1 Tax=Sphingobium yanoikuyae TaxID=13690 RepID=UPI00131EDF21
MWRELKKLGYVKLKARPRHHAQNEYAFADFKKGGDLPLPRQSLDHNESPAVKYDGPDACTGASSMMLSSCTKARRACGRVVGVRTSLPPDMAGRASCSSCSCPCASA